MSTNGKFIGHYVDEMALVMTASAVSNQHAIFIGKPGCGKTDIVRSACERMFGNDSIFIRLNPTTPPEKLVGTVDPAGLLESPSVWRYNREGTAEDPNAMSIILDEIFRASDAVNDININTLNRQDNDNPDDAPIVIATANFLNITERTEALLDRFPFYYWVPNEHLELADVVRSHLTSLGKRLEVDSDLPTLQETLDVQKAVPTDNSIKAVTEKLEELVGEMTSADNDLTWEMPNRRRIKFWDTMLFRTTVYFGGVADFTEVHEKATTALAWSQVLRSEKEAQDWKSMMSGLADPMGLIIENIMKSTYKKMQEVVDAYPGDAVTASGKLGPHVQECLAEIKQYIDDGDERFNQAAYDLQSTIQRLVTGKDVVGG